MEPLQSPITLTSRNRPRENDQTHAVLGDPGTLRAPGAPLCTRLKWQQERPEAHSCGSSALGWGVKLGGHSSLLLGGDLPVRRPMGGHLATLPSPVTPLSFSRSPGPGWRCPRSRCFGDRGAGGTVPLPALAVPQRRQNPEAECRTLPTRASCQPPITVSPGPGDLTAAAYGLRVTSPLNWLNKVSSSFTEAETAAFDTCSQPGLQLCWGGVVGETWPNCVSQISPLSAPHRTQHLLENGNASGEG